jgi:hypothetical protein
MIGKINKSTKEKIFFTLIETIITLIETIITELIPGKEDTQGTMKLLHYLDNLEKEEVLKFSRVKVMFMVLFYSLFVLVDCI